MQVSSRFNSKTLIFRVYENNITSLHHINTMHSSTTLMKIYTTLLLEQNITPARSIYHRLKNLLIHLRQIVLASEYL